MKIRLLCPVCESDDIVCDAYAKWNYHKQEWELSSVYDAKECGACDSNFNEAKEEIIHGGISTGNGTVETCT